MLIESTYPKGFQKAERADAIGVGGVLGGIETHLHMAHGREVVDFIGLRFLNDADKVGAVGEIAVMQLQAAARLMGILIEVVDSVGIEQRRPALDAVHEVTLIEEQFGEVGTVLPGDSCDECGFHDVGDDFSSNYKDREWKSKEF
jgi:hypothetical protein